MPGLPLKRFYSYTDEFKESLTADTCVSKINESLTKYTRESLLRVLSSISIELGPSNDPLTILNIQLKYLNVPKEIKRYVFHRQAILVLFQFILSTPKNNFGNKSAVPNNEVFMFFILINEYLNLGDNFEFKKSVQKKLFFNAIKNVQFMNNTNDLQADFEFFNSYAEKIKLLNNPEYEKLVKSQLDFTIPEFLEVLKKIKAFKFKEIFPLLEKFAVLNVTAIDEAWNERDPKLEIPYEYNFLMHYPLLKIDKDFLLVDAQFLFSSLYRRIYEILIAENKEQFKGIFGERISEPVIKDFQQTNFCSNKILNLNVAFNTRQFADSALVYNKCIFLFEIKSSLLSNKVLYTKSYEYFIKGFNNKFILNEGVHQQLKRLIDIDTDFKNFSELTKIDKNTVYTIYPVLLVFDEKLQSFLANWYISTRFDNLKRCLHFSPSNFILANNHITITFNELYRLNALNKSRIKKIGLLKQYADDDEKQIFPFEIFLQQKGLFKNN